MVFSRYAEHAVPGFRYNGPTFSMDAQVPNCFWNLRHSREGFFS